jgi:hypothetical protein
MQGDSRQHAEVKAKIKQQKIEKKLWMSKMQQKIQIKILGRWPT